MPLFDPADLARWTGGRWRVQPPAGRLGPLVADTRRLAAGEVFVALRTARRDGHDFLGAAHSAGAGAAVVARETPEAALAQLLVADPAAAWRAVAREHRLRFPGPVAGVTGSAGKTSTKELLRAMLGPDTLATHANENNLLGVPLTLCRLDPARHRAAVIEAGINEPGEMAALADMIRPDAALVTLVAPAHLEKLGSLENIAREKALLARAARPGGWTVMPAACLHYAAFRELPGPCVAVAPVDAPAPALTAARLFRYRAEARPRNGWRLGLAPAGEAEQSWSLPPVTPGLAANAALAIVAAQILGVPDDRIQAALAAWQPALLRGEWLRAGGKIFLADCYNANPASMADALAGFAARADAALPRLYVLGSMAELGPDAPALHRGAVAALKLRPNDRALVLGPYATEYQAALLAAGHPASQVWATSVGEARADVAKFAGAVFLKGSRAYALEQLLPAELREGREGHAPC